MRVTLAKIMVQMKEYIQGFTGNGKGKTIIGKG
jgi:hypothetical protein